MTDFLLLYLGTISGTLILVLVVVVSLIELRRRSRILSERAERYPAACELETLTHDVARLEEHRARLQEEAEDAKSVIRRRESAEHWLEANHTLKMIGPAHRNPTPDAGPTFAPGHALAVDPTPRAG